MRLGSEPCCAPRPIFISMAKRFYFFCDKFRKSTFDIFLSKDTEYLWIEIMKGMLKSINQTKYTVFEHVCKINVTLLLGLQWPLSRAGSLLPDDECLCPVHIRGCCLGKSISPLSQKRVKQTVFSSRNLQKSICDSVFRRLLRLRRLVFALGLRDGFRTAGKICICTVGYLGRKSIQVSQWPCWLAWKHPAEMRTDDHAGDLQKMKSKSTNVSMFNMLSEMSN